MIKKIYTFVKIVSYEFSVIKFIFKEEDKVEPELATKSAAEENLDR